VRDETGKGSIGVPPVRDETGKGSIGVPPVRDESGKGSIGVPPVRTSAGVMKSPVTASLSKRRRILPHWEAGDSTYFLTFRVLEGELSEAERGLVLDACRHWDPERMLLHAAVVMPDHAHLLCTPLEKERGVWWSLADLMHSIKGFTAKRINELRGEHGLVWQREYFDRVIRAESDFDEKWSYIVTNPQRRGLPEDYEWVWVESPNDPPARRPENSHRRDADAPLAGEPPHTEHGSAPSISDSHRRDADAPLARDSSHAQRGAESSASDSHRRDADARLARDSSHAQRGAESSASDSHRRDADAPLRVSLLVWTTTPWTLISNHFAAVHPEIEYALVEDAGDGEEPEYLYIAKDLVETITKKAKRELRVVSYCRGEELIGLRYVPPYREHYNFARSPYSKPTGPGQAPIIAGPSLPDFEPLFTALVCDLGKSAGEALAETHDGHREPIGWRVLPAGFVTIDSGTGIVHEAPAFGEVDFDLLQEERRRFLEEAWIPLLCAVHPDGTFNGAAPEQYRGRWVKECDKDIIRELKERGLLYHQETYRHEYPFCPRAENDPLIQYARKSWFVRTSRYKDEFLANNAAIHWLPEHIKEGRFGDFLRNNVDWALSRERYWGTPLPIWRCESCDLMEAVGSFEELRSRPEATDGGYWERKKAEHPEMPDDLRVHKPYIDEWTYECAACAGQGARNREQAGRDREIERSRDREEARARANPESKIQNPESAGSASVPRMRRVPEVIDCWWDAGSMPFAQWGFPHVEGSVDLFLERFPADFISEAIDQTRGWFYGLLSISTLLFGENSPNADNPKSKIQNPKSPYPHPYRTCIVLGHMMGEDGLKMSKRTKNYKEPSYVFDHYGADAMRWYFFSAQTPWTSARFQESNIRDAQREFLVRLYNVFSFFNIYANIDGFTVESDEATKPRSDEGEHRRPAGADGARDGSGIGDRGSGARSQPDPRSLIPDPRGTGWRPVAQRSELDRWIVGELHGAIRFVREKMDAFENYPAAGRLNDFVDALSNWYVRRSRERFWKPVEGKESHEATKPRSHEGAERSEQGTGSRQQKQSPIPDPRSPIPDPRSPIPDPRSPIPASGDQEKWDAYNTLYEMLLTLSKLIAPFTPFFAEMMYQNLGGTGNREQGTEGQEGQEGSEDGQERSGEQAGMRETARDDALFPVPCSLFPLSVHLCDYPEADASLIDEQLAAEMGIVRELVSLGRSARTAAKLRVRQPLALVEIILAKHEHEPWLASHAPLIAEELNVKQVDFATQADHYVSYQIKADFKAIGPRFGKLAPQIAKALQSLDAAAARQTLTDTGELRLEVNGQTVALTDADVQIRLEARPGWSAAPGRAGVVVVKTELTPELLEEGLIRELVHHVQGLRKEMELAYQARITLHIECDEKLAKVIERHADVIQRECLVERIAFAAADGVEMRDLTIEEHALRLGIAT
jgi:isoleucyl-tRNA synthetase